MFSDYVSRIPADMGNRKGRIGEVTTPHDDFSGLRYIKGLPPDAILGTNFDGVGTKIEVAERLWSYTGDPSYHRGIASDLFAMVCDDAVVRGAEPVLVGSILDANKLYPAVVEQLAEGMVDAALEARVAVINGETAELGDRVGGYGDIRYNWGASVVWVAKEERLIDGSCVEAGDALVGFRETGFRSNGLTLVRKILRDRYGKRWHEKEHEGENVAETVLTPSCIYTPVVVDVVGGYENTPWASVKAVAHITGGGIPEKLGRALRPSGYGADISDPFEPPEFMHYCQEIGNVDDAEAYRTWNMGNGMVVVTPEPDNVIVLAKEHGIHAKRIGEVRKRRGIRIRNRGALSSRVPEITF
jgi:phosphoribosylformylglycinamidine cyclo-ligase